MFPSLLQAYGLDKNYLFTPFGTGLINHTWKIECPGMDTYVVQKINQEVFRQPSLIAANIQMVANYLNSHSPTYLFPVPIPTVKGDTLVQLNEGYFRILPYVQDSKTVDVLEQPAQAYAAAQAFGKFCRLLAGMEAKKLNITIPCFHDLSLRYSQFQEATRKANKGRIASVSSALERLEVHTHIVKQYEELREDSRFRIRVIHHDTKISNVLFNSKNECLCVIDLDTLMPGYFMSDLGDMLRTYVSPVGEEEQDFSKIEARPAYIKAVIEGYLSEMGPMLTSLEKKHLLYAGKFMIYMQALRFITDYLNNDKYYGAKYPEHNLNRGLNQLELLEKLAAYETSEGLGLVH